MKRAIEAAESTVETGRDEIRLEAGEFDPHKFDQLAAPAEQKANAPWLRKRKLLGESEAKIYVVDLERGVERPGDTGGNRNRRLCGRPCGLSKADGTCGIRVGPV